MFEIESFAGGFTMTNGYLLRLDEDRHILIDAPEGIAHWLRERQVKVEALLLTHLHFDHILDAAALRTIQDCTIYSFAHPSSDLTLESMLAQYGMPVKVDPFEVDHLLKGRDRVSVAGMDFEVLHVPGHSPDGVCFRPLAETSEGERVLFSGDALFQRSIGRTDFPHSDHELLVSGIREKLFTLPGDTIVFPGHGPWTTIEQEIEENPFV